MSKGKKLANTNILVMAQKQNSLFDFLYTEVSQDKFEKTIKELQFQEEMMVKLKTEIETYPKALDGIYKFNAQFPQTLGRIFATKEQKSDLLHLGQRLVAAHHGTKEFQEMMADEISDLNHVFKEWFIGFANCKSKLKERLKEVRNFNHYYNKIPRLKQEKNLKEATGQGERASKSQNKIERNERKFKETGIRLKNVHKECYEMMTQIIKNRYVLINPAVLRFIGALRRFYSGVAGIFVVFVEEKYEKGEFDAPPPERRYNASVLHQNKKKVKKQKGNKQEAKNPDVDLNLEASMVGGFKFDGFGQPGKAFHDPPRGQSAPTDGGLSSQLQQNPTDFREEFKEVQRPQELSAVKKAKGKGKQAAAAGGQTKLPPAASIAALAHQKKPSAQYDVDLGDFNEKEGNIYAAGSKNEPPPTSFNFEFDPTSSGFPKKKPEELKGEKQQNFKAALSPPPKSQKTPGPAQISKHPPPAAQDSKKTGKLKEMFQKAKKGQKKEEIQMKESVRIPQKSASPEPQIIFEDEVKPQPESHLPPHFRVLQEQQKKEEEQKRRKEALAAQNPALARFGDPSLFQNTPPPKQVSQQFDNFDFGSQVVEEPQDKFASQKKQDSFGELNALRFGGRPNLKQSTGTPQTYGYGGDRAAVGGSIEMGVMNKREEVKQEEEPNTHEDLIARRFGGALALEDENQYEEEKIGSYQNRPPQYGYDPYPMTAEAEENRFEEGFSYTNAPEEAQWNFGGEQGYNSEVSAPPDSQDSDDDEESVIDQEAQEGALGGHLARFGGILADPRFKEQEEASTYRSTENQQQQQKDWRANYMQDISLKDDYNLYYTHKKPNQPERPSSQMEKRTQASAPQQSQNPQMGGYSSQPKQNQQMLQQRVQQQTNPYHVKNVAQQGVLRPEQEWPGKVPIQAQRQQKGNVPERKQDLNTSNPSQGSGDQQRPMSQMHIAAQKQQQQKYPPQAQPRPYNPYTAQKMQPPTLQQPVRGAAPPIQRQQPPHMLQSLPQKQQHPGVSKPSMPQQMAAQKGYLAPQTGMSRNPQMGHSHQKSMPGPLQAGLAHQQPNPYVRQTPMMQTQVHMPQPYRPPQIQQQPDQFAPSHSQQQLSGVKSQGHFSEMKPPAAQKKEHDPFDFGIDLSSKDDRTASIHKNNPFM